MSKFNARGEPLAVTGDQLNLGPEIRTSTDAQAPPSSRTIAATHDLAGALHEVSNALTVVLGWIEQAREESESPADVERALDVAAARARHARHIVRRAIGAEVPEDPPSTIAAVIGDAVTGLEPEARRAGLTIHTLLDPTVESTLIAGGSTVLQILTNLLLNAIALSPAGASIRVDAAPDEQDYVIFGVSDRGPGVLPERRATLFDAGISTRAGGAGVGLRHAAALAREQGGTLSIAAADAELAEAGRDAPAGARFELHWPKKQRATVVPSRASRSSSSALAGVRILVIEDDEAVIDLLETALCGRGAQIISAKNRAELADALRRGPFDTALVDISPIQEDVRGAVEAVVKSSPSARFIVMSGSSSELPALPGSLPVAWVRKPFEISEIVAAIRAAMQDFNFSSM